MNGIDGLEVDSIMSRVKPCRYQVNQLDVEFDFTIFVPYEASNGPMEEYMYTVSMA